jgi:hypothetical protein
VPHVPAVPALPRPGSRPHAKHSSSFLRPCCEYISLSSAHPAHPTQADMAGLFSPRNATESTPLLGHPGNDSDGNAPSAATRLRKHMAVNIDKDWADLVLLFCYIITGLLDSSAVFIWGSFVSMQTGRLYPCQQHSVATTDLHTVRKHCVSWSWAGSTT